uniref:Lipoprotein n=1 Tax=Streptomyces sp. NBC_00008 TaxID=2903610 RepID=A0AAU2VSR5_9ACTN
MRKLVRTGAVVATGLLTALTLTGCGSDDDKPDAEKGSGSASAPAPDHSVGSSTGGADGGGASTGGPEALEGAWAGQTDGKAVVLSVAHGKAVVVADSHVCSGSAKGTDKVTLALKCADGDTDRTAGTVESNDGKTIVVAWDGGTKDSLGKTDADSLEGLPGLPTP